VKHHLWRLELVEPWCCSALLLLLWRQLPRIHTAGTPWVDEPHRYVLYPQTQSPYAHPVNINQVPLFSAMLHMSKKLHSMLLYKRCDLWREWKYPSLSRAEVKNEWSYKFVSPVHLHGTYRDNFILAFMDVHWNLNFKFCCQV